MDRTNKSVFIILATGILLITATFRLAYLQDVPPGLTRDEALDADIAALILQGQHALFFREGYGHEPLYHYLAAPFQRLVGDNFIALRLPSVYLGLLLVAVTMLWARREFGDLTALFTGAFIAISWWPIIFSRIGLRPILEPLLVVLAFSFWFHRPWLAGIFLGLSMYSYTAARVFLVLPLLFLAYQFLFRKRLKIQAGQHRATLIVLFVSLLIYLPMGLTLLADPTLQERVQQLSGPLSALRAGDFWPVWQSMWATLGVFTFTGDPLWSYTLPNRPLFDPLTGLFFYFGVALAFWRARERQVYGLLLVGLALALAPAALAPDAPGIIRLIGAIPIVYLLVSLAVSWVWSKWSSRRPVRIGRLVNIGAFFLFSLLALNVYRTVESFVLWPTASQVRQKYQSIWLDISRHWREQPVEGLVVADSWYEPIKAASLRRDYGYDLPARWVQGGRAVVFPDTVVSRFYVPEFAPLSTELAALLDLGQPLYRSQGQPSFAVYDLPPVPDMPDTVAFVSFRLAGATEPAITLAAYEILPTGASSTLKIVTYWQVASLLPADLTIFVHLLDQNGQLVAQHDGLDAAPETLRIGDTIVQLHTITLEEPGGPFALATGLYTLSNGRRLIPIDRPGDAVVVERDVFVGEE